MPPRPHPAHVPPAAGRRLGPRPLALHLSTGMWAWLSSPAAWTLSRAGSLPWRPELRPAAEALARDLAATDPDAFARALEAEARRGFAAFVEGVLAYRRHPYRRALAEPPVLWSEGSTRLLDYGAVAPAARAPALIVPSLVNRAYVLDLAPGASLLRFLAGRGVRPLLVDWGAPGAGERAFTLGDYVAGRLSRALDRALALAGGPLPVVGYCMGGNLALALAARRRNGVAALALLATPWDFHAGLAIPPASVVAIARALEPAIELFGELPVDALQALFAALDPKAVARKFHAFAGLDPGSARARAFVALEDWLNDGVALVGPVARETLIGWYGENTPARGAWRIAGRAVRPEEVRAPALVALPEGDRIVPPPSAEALAAALPGATTLRVAAGHIGMVVGRRARAGLWRPLADWLLAQSRAAKSAPCA